MTGRGVAFADLDNGEVQAQITVIPAEDGYTIVRISEAEKQRIASITLRHGDLAALGKAILEAADEGKKRER